MEQYTRLPGVLIQHHAQFGPVIPYLTSWNPSGGFLQGAPSIARRPRVCSGAWGKEEEMRRAGVGPGKTA